ncbi:hypothetical protein FWC63_03220 [Candidatus Saccharibacteria bacterium]|nr:hypothetical protein [Candidatus Saccharibacteria bacterium]
MNIKLYDGIHILTHSYPHEVTIHFNENVYNVDKATVETFLQSRRYQSHNSLWYDLSEIQYGAITLKRNISHDQAAPPDLEIEARHLAREMILPKKASHA